MSTFPAALDRDGNRQVIQSNEAFLASSSWTFVEDGTGDTGAHTLFTVTGDVLMTVFGVCGTNLAGAATIEVGTANNTAALIAQIGDATDLDAGENWVDATPEAEVSVLPGAKIVGGGADAGGKLRDRFMKNVPALKKLTDDVQRAVKTNGFLKGLDGRKMRTRSDHSALNLLLQGAGALVMKRWLIEVMKRVDERGLDANPVLNIHDEAQFDVHEDDAEEMAALCEECMPIAGEYFKFRIPIEGEAKIGNNWAETH